MPDEKLCLKRQTSIQRLGKKTSFFDLDDKIAVLLNKETELFEMTRPMLYERGKVL
ncbi:hypothetical protein [Scytonema sp. NUACC21]